MTDVLLRMLDHMRWADQCTADAIERADAPNADAVRLFGHVATVAHVWYSRIMGSAPAYAIWPTLSVAESRALAAEHADLFTTLVGRADAGELDRTVSYRNSAGHPFTNTIGDIVTHLCLHGEHHRGQIARELRAAGQEPAVTDFIQFVRRDQ